MTSKICCILAHLPDLATGDFRLSRTGSARARSLIWRRIDYGIQSRRDTVDAPLPMPFVDRSIWLRWRVTSRYHNFCQLQLMIRSRRLPQQTSRASPTCPNESLLSDRCIALCHSTVVLARAYTPSYKHYAGVNPRIRNLARWLGYTSNEVDITGELNGAPRQLGECSTCKKRKEMTTHHLY
jgi:hypothetical protein